MVHTADKSGANDCEVGNGFLLALDAAITHAKPPKCSPMIDINQWTEWKNEGMTKEEIAALVAKIRGEGVACIAN